MQQPEVYENDSNPTEDNLTSLDVAVADSEENGKLEKDGSVQRKEPESIENSDSVQESDAENIVKDSEDGKEEKGDSVQGYEQESLEKGQVVVLDGESDEDVFICRKSNKIFKSLTEYLKYKVEEENFRINVKKTGPKKLSIPTLVPKKKRQTKAKKDSPKSKKRKDNEDQDKVAGEATDDYMVTEQKEISPGHEDDEEPMNDDEEPYYDTGGPDPDENAEPEHDEEIPGPKRNTTSTNIVRSRRQTSAPVKYDPDSYVSPREKAWEKTSKSADISSVPDSFSHIYPSQLSKKGPTDNTSHTSTKKIHAALVKFLTVDLQPASVAQSETFLELIKVLNPDYTPPTETAIMERILVDIARETKTKIKQDFVSAFSPYVALSVESWVHGQSRGFVTMCAHFINTKWDRVSVMLDTVDCTEHTSGEALASTLKKITDDWNISDRVIFLVSDGSNPLVAEASTCANWMHFLCFGSALNTVVVNAINCVPEVVCLYNKVCEVAEFFQNCQKAADTLLAVQRQHCLPIHKLKQAYDGGWNATYILFKRMMEQFEAVNTVLCFLNKNDICLEDEEVSLMKNVVRILKPFQHATEELCSSDFICSSMIIPLSSLLMQLTVSQAITDPGHNGPQALLKDALMKQMEQHFSYYEKMFELAVSTLLDPRFKKHAINDHIILNKAQAYIQEEIAKFVQKIDSSSKTIAVNDGTSELWHVFDNRVDEVNQPTSTTPSSSSTEANSECKRYFEEANITRSSDLMKWWKVSGSQHPRMKVMAQKYLSIPATAIPGIRLFRKQGAIFQRSRAALKHEHLRHMLFLNMNFDYSPCQKNYFGRVKD